MPYQIKREKIKYCRSCGNPLTQSESDRKHECNDCKLNNDDLSKRESFLGEEDE